MLHKPHNLTPNETSGPARPPKVWPIQATNPPLLIPAIAEDGSLYPVEKIEAHVKGLQHLALSIFVFSGDELLIQQRASSKYHCGNLWANTCCTHPNFGEDLQQAAERRLDEELGFQSPLEYRRTVDYCADVGGGLWENERVHMFCAQVTKDQLTFKINPQEVMDFRWINKTDLLAEIASSPENFTPWLRIYADQFPDMNF